MVVSDQQGEHLSNVGRSVRRWISALRMITQERIDEDACVSRFDNKTCLPQPCQLHMITPARLLDLGADRTPTTTRLLALPVWQAPRKRRSVSRLLRRAPFFASSA